ncbi:hypothetical protein LTR08_008833 [Meristemomyces frigidus]|nr:hypothetical protein LTR08_008833 [Meristemomyces frigidus]
MADTWALVKHGSPSAAVRIPNPEWKPEMALDDWGKPNQAKWKRGPNKRKAASDRLAPSSPTSSGKTLQDATEIPDSPESVIELSSRLNKRPKMASASEIIVIEDDFPLQGMGLHDPAPNTSDR